MKKEKIQKTESKILDCWWMVEVAIFHTKVFLFIGNRREMLETGAAALRLMAFSDEAVADIGKSLARVIPCLESCVVVGECFHVETEKNGDVFFIRLDSFRPGFIEDMMVLSHECLHVAMHVLKACGVQEVGNRECLCYLHEYINKEFLMQTCRNMIEEVKEESFGRDCLSCSHSQSEETTNGDVLHCREGGKDKIVKENHVCGKFKD